MPRLTIQGRVHAILEPRTFGANHTTSQTVVIAEEAGKYTEYIPVDFTGDNAVSVRDLAIGQSVLVDAALGGREYTKDGQTRYFGSVKGFRILPEGEAVSEAPSGAKAKEPKAPPIGSNFDDVPF